MVWNRSAHFIVSKFQEKKLEKCSFFFFFFRRNGEECRPMYIKKKGENCTNAVRQSTAFTTKSKLQSL